MRVLIIDDHQLIRAAVRDLLLTEYSDLKCVEVDSGKSALTAVQNNTFDLAVVDLFLPNEAPFVLIRKLRDQLPDLPLIVLSASDNQVHMKTSIELGVVAYISKNEAMEVIVETVNKVLAGEDCVSEKKPLANDFSSLANGDDLPELDLDEVIKLLTGRQLDILNLVALGMSNKEIARERNLSDNTIKVHVSAILRALNLNNRTQLGLLAQKIGMLHGN